jgi:hypothetical protein
MLRILLPLVLLLAACPPVEEEEEGWSCTPATVAVDTLEATVDGDAWDATFSGGSATNAGGVNITFRVDANNTLSLRLLRASTFTDADDHDLTDPLVVDNAVAFDAGDLPLEIALGEGADDGGDATLTLASASYNTAHGDGGYAKITGFDAGVVTGCLYFHAGLQNGSGETTLTAGSFSATLP